MRQHAAIAIAALMITSIAFAISASNVSAAHAPTVEITPTLTTTGDMDFEIKVTNTGGSPITSVDVTLPFTVDGWVGALTVDTVAASTLVASGTVLPAGTEIPIDLSYDLTLAENTPVTISKDDKVTMVEGITVIVPMGTTIASGVPNLIPINTTVTLKYDTSLPLAAITSPKNLGVTLPAGGEVILPAGTKVELDIAMGTDLPAVTLAADTDGLILSPVGDATLDADTEGKTGPGETTGVKLTATTYCPLVEDSTTAFPATTSQVKVLKDTKVSLTLSAPIESEEVLTIDTDTTLWEASTVVLDADVGLVPISDTAEFALPPDYEITATLTAETPVTLPKDMEIVLPAISNGVKLETGTTLALPIPSNWTVTMAAGTNATWESATAEDGIGPGESLTFSIRATVLGNDGNFLWTIKTTADDGSIAYRTLTTTLDSTKPTLTVTMEPEMVGAGPATIKVEASEVLSNLDNVYYQLDDNADHIGDPAKLIAMESADGITWTGTLTIPGDGLWDESKVDIVVLAALTKDMTGNALVGDEDVNIHDPAGVRHIDTIPPVLPADLEMTATAPFDNEVNQKSQLITGTTKDNIGGAEIIVGGMTVKISVNGTTYETTSFGNGAFTKEIDLNEGPNTVKVWVIDELSNVGPENEQAVFLDSIKPTISMVSVADKAYEDNVPVKDNTPTVVLTIKDPGYPATALGIEYGNITVELQEANGTPIYTLDNAIPWDKATGRFENTIPLEQVEGFYRIYVEATDLATNVYSATFWFEVDVTAPTMPSLTVMNNPVLNGTTVAEPKVQKETKLVLYGSDLEELAIVKIYLIDQATGSVISTETTEATDTGDFSKSLTLAEGKVIRIEAETTDAAGNVSLGPRPVYGYVMVDATAPVVTLGTLPGTTDETSVILSGTVTKDDWESWSDITLTVQVGIGSVDVQIGAEGGYSCSVPLSMGANTIAVRATDSVGNASIPATATVERVVSMDTSAPGVTLEALPEATDKTSVTISGTVTKDAWESWSDITLTVQVGTGRVEVPIGAGGSYSYSIGLAEGSNTIAVQATDAVGNAGTAAYATVERTVTPWGTYAIVLVIVALVIAAIAIFRGSKIWKR